MTMAQLPESAAYDSMPRNAITAALVSICHAPGRNAEAADRLCLPAGIPQGRRSCVSQSWTVLAIGTSTVFHAVPGYSVPGSVPKLHVDFKMTAPERRLLAARRYQPLDLFDPVLDENQFGEGLGLPFLHFDHQEPFTVTGDVPSTDRAICTVSSLLKDEAWLAH